jgi:integrase/recombinase XerD
VGSEDHSNVRTRNQAIITMLLCCGLRRAEVLGLGIGDVDLKSGCLKVWSGKGEGPADPDGPGGNRNHRRLAGVSACRRARLPTEGAGGPLSVKGVVPTFELVKRRAGLVRKGVKLYTLRHTFALSILQEGCDLVSIKEMLRRADPATTAIYLHVCAAHLQAAAALHPLNG